MQHGVRGCRADGVAGIDVLQHDGHAGRREVAGHGLAEERADVERGARVAQVARRVALGVRRRELLAAALGDDDDRVRAVAKPSRERRQEAALAGEGERELRDQAEVRLAARDRRVRGDEPGVAPHQLDDADPVVRGERLGVRGVDGGPRVLDGGVEADRLVHERDVVIDGLGNGDDRDLRAAARDLVDDLGGRAQRAVAADGEQRVDRVALERVDERGATLVGPRHAQHGSTQPVHVTDDLGRERHRLEATGGHALEAVAKAEDRGDAVAVVQLEDDGADDVVRARAHAAGRHDRGAKRRRVEGQRRAGPRLREGMGQIDRRRRARFDARERACVGFHERARER